MLRITGMDLKMEQYRKGEAFVPRSSGSPAAAALRRLWDGPETLPTAGRDRPARRTGSQRMGLNQLDGRDGVTEGPDRSAGTGRGAGRRPDGDRADADPVRPLPGARPRGDPGGRARRAPRHDRLRRPSRRPARRRRGDAPRPPAGRDIRPDPRPCPELRWVHSATAGVERVADARVPRARVVITNARASSRARSPST